MSQINWISVKDRLPPPDEGTTSSERVLVTDGENIGTAYYSLGTKDSYGISRPREAGWELSESWWHSITFGDVNLKRVTHWVPIEDLVSTIPK
jgi:hypothetical protein